ncbi:hypothetical protein NL676_009650 [Syzygium grande]|nr:hypothetical protein NL676_009650 [Syzygium grande]
MDARASFYLLLPFLVLLAIWPGTLTGGLVGQLSSTGFELTTGANFSINDVPDTWSGRVSCNGAGAIPSASLAEFTLARGAPANMTSTTSASWMASTCPSLQPHRRGGECGTTRLQGNINSVCPSELAVQGSNGSVVACKSACLALNQPAILAAPAVRDAETCPPTAYYSKIFKARCPQAYSYAYDDKSSTFTCAGGAGFLITFCPQAGRAAILNRSEATGAHPSINDVPGHAVPSSGVGHATPLMPPRKFVYAIADHGLAKELQWCRGDPTCLLGRVHLHPLARPA